MQKNIDKQIGEIIGNLREELTLARAIDKTGRATDVARFNQILDEKIESCYDLLARTEEDGVTIDKYAANIAYSRIARLEKMKELGTIAPESAWFEQTEDKGEKRAQRPNVEKASKKTAFNLGIKKLFARINASFRSSKTSENDR